MTSNRPYRLSMEVDEAISEILSNSGTQFDPNIAKEFVKLLEGNKQSMERKYLDNKFLLKK